MPPKLAAPHQDNTPHIHCLKCKNKTGNVNPEMRTTSNGRPQVTATCVGCGIKKSTFVKKGAGDWYNPATW